MLGIDISNWNGWPFNAVTSEAFKVAEFVIVKATEGTGYVSPACDSQYQHAKKNGKLLGVYHYANGGSSSAEAEFFYKNVKGYIGEAIPVLDWEGGGNASWGSKDWAYSFAARFHELSGVWPMIYVQASALEQVRKCASKCALWVAGYPTNAASWTVPPFQYYVSGWAISIWQFSSGGGIDRNYSQLTPKQWNLIAGGGNKRPRYAPKDVQRYNSYMARKDLAVRKSHGTRQQRVGTVKKGAVVKFETLHRNTSGIWWGKIADGKWVPVLDSWTAESYFKRGAVVKTWPVLKVPKRKALEALSVYDKPSTESGKKLGTVPKGTALVFSSARRNFYGNIWGKVAKGKHAGRYVLMKSGKTGWKVSH